MLPLHEMFITGTDFSLGADTSLNAIVTVGIFIIHLLEAILIKNK